MTTRMLPPPGSLAPIEGRTGTKYTPSAATYLDVADSEATRLAENGWIPACGAGAGKVLGQAGPTASRPCCGYARTSKPHAGTLYLDTTLGYIVVYDGASWRNPATGAVV